MTTGGPWFLDWPAPLHPYVRTTQRQKFCDPRYKKYQSFKGVFRAAGNCAGIPNSLDKDKRYRIIFNTYCEGKSRADLDNLVKGVLDALFEQDNQIKEIWAKLHENHSESHTTIALEVIHD